MSLLQHFMPRWRLRQVDHIAVRTELLNSPEKLALSASGLPGDNGIALQLAGIQSAMLLGNGSATLEDYFQGMVGALGVQAAEARELAENQGVVLTAIENERAAISGVNLDEEAVSLITHQRAFQAAARYLAVVKHRGSAMSDEIAEYRVTENGLEFV